MLVFLLLFAVLSIKQFFFYTYGDEKKYIFEDVFDKEESASVKGKIHQIEEKQNIYIIYLKGVLVQFDTSNQNTYILKNLIVYVEDVSNLHPGNEVVVEGMLQELESATNHGQFDEKSYYKQQNIYYKMFAQSIQVVNPKKSVCKTFLYTLRKEVKAVYEDILPMDCAGNISAMVLGDKSGLPEDVKSLYQSAGIGHLLAISGLHIHIISIGFFSILMFFGFSQKKAAGITILFVILYAVLTGMSISTNRAMIMMILSLFAKIIGRTYDAKTALGIAGIVVLFQKPDAVLQSGFLLSFGAMVAIFYVCPLLTEIFLGTKEEREERKRRRKRKIKEDAANRRWCSYVPGFYVWKEKLIESSLYSLGIQFVTYPVILSSYYEMPLYGILVNMIAIPCMTFLLIMAVVSLFAGIIFRPAGIFLGGSIRAVFVLYEMLGNLSMQLPGSRIVTGAPKPVRIIVYYMMLTVFVCFLTYIHERKNKGRIRKLVFFVFLLSGICFVPQKQENLSMTFLDVGQGDCVYFQGDAGCTYLVDGGSTTESDVGKYRIAPFLKYKGIGVLDYVFISHLDADHYNGIYQLIEADNGIRIRNLCVSPYTIGEEEFKEIAILCRKRKINILPVYAGRKIQDKKLSVSVLYPEKSNEEVDDKNEKSLVLNVQYETHNILLTGDIGEETEKKLLEEQLLSKIDVLKVAHHGSKYSSAEEFLKTLSPQISIISSGEGNTYGHPHRETMERLKDYCGNVFRTDTDGELTVTVEETKLEVAKMKKP